MRTRNDRPRGVLTSGTEQGLRRYWPSDDLAPFVEQFAMSTRRMQRLFREYVGVTPKWVIQRYRLIEAAARLAAGRADDLADLALDLGYADQAHFIRDFKRIVGRPPAGYA